MNAVRSLLTNLIDYAGLFPPAGLEMAQAVRGYAAYHRGDQSWALGRFVVPLARLSEFERAVAEIPPQDRAGGPWRVSALGAPGSALDARQIAAFNQTQAQFAVIDTVEVKPERAQDIPRTTVLLPPGAIPYFEISPAQNPGEFLEILAEKRARAKIRTGGIQKELFPAAAEIARFLSLCAGAKVPFKATAGLHHAVRSEHRLTYEPDSPSAMMHGFLNVFLAAALAWRGAAPEELLETLEETSASAFRFEETGVSWHAHRLSAEDLAATRQNFAIAFGSCSFEEPLEDLKALGLL